MSSTGMSPFREIDEISALRKRLAELEAEVLRQKWREHASETRFRLLAESAPVMIWMSGADALGTYFNRAWLEFRGRSLDQETGNGWTQGLHPDDRDFCIGNYLR